MTTAPKYLVENVITLLAYDDRYGKQAYPLVEAKLFEGEYRDIADRILTYWKEHRRAPGPHLIDITADMLESGDPARIAQIRLILSQMQELKESMNAEYILSTLDTFVGSQRLIAEVLKAMQTLQQGKTAENLGKAQSILYSALRNRPDDTFDPGLTLDDVESVLAYWRNRDEHDIPYGIEPLDRNKLTMQKQTLTVFIAPYGFGKTWFLIYCGRRALMYRRKVLHITLELSAHQVLCRYYQSIFSVPQREGLIRATQMNMEGRRLESLSTYDIMPEFVLNPQARDVDVELWHHLRGLGGKTRYIHIKRLPTGSLTIDKLNGILDSLQDKGFIPDMLIIDYPKLMKLPVVDFRHHLGHAFEGIRGICVERNLIGVVVHQSSKEGKQSTQVEGEHTSEDWSITGTADNIMTFSASKGEKALGLGRLYVDKARDTIDKYTVLLTQSYAIGQFALEGYQIPRNYFEEYYPQLRGERNRDDDGQDLEEGEEQNDEGNAVRAVRARRGFVRD